MSCQVIEIDGSVLEGGGQILRIALTLSALKRTPVRITKIRAGRSKPGLREQHLKGVEIMRDISNGKVKGASLGSSEVEFWPGNITGGQYEAKSETFLKLHGGTNADMAPQIDYMMEVFRPNLEKFGATFDFDLIRRGYFPKGGGQVTINVKPIPAINPVNLVDFGQVSSIYGWSFVAGSLPIKLANAMADSASHTLKRTFHNLKIERYKEDRSVAPDNCSGILLVAKTSTGCILGGSALGKPREAPEETGKRAALELQKSIEEGACVDEHTQDQIIVFMALAKGPSRVRIGEITLHTKTAVFAAEKLTKAKFEIVPDGASNILECTGDNNTIDDHVV